MGILTDWSLIMPFVVKGIVSCVLIAFIGYGLSGALSYHEPDDDKE